MSPTRAFGTAVEMTESSPVAGAFRPTVVGRIAAGLALIVTFVTVASGCSTPAAGSLPRRLSTAIDQMQSKDGYSFEASVTTGSSTAGIHVDGTFTAPNSITQSVRVPGRAPVEMRLTGTEVSIKDPATGSFAEAKSASSSPFDLRRAFDALRSARSTTRTDETFTFTLDGNTTRTLAGSDATGEATVVATTGGNGLERLEYRVTAGGRPTTVVIDYR